MNEIWKDIKGYEGLYKVSNYGRIFSKRRKKIISEAIDSRGYSYVMLHNRGDRKNYRVHRLVADAFIENQNNFAQVNHKDENKQNNVVDNLEWCDAKYNSNYGTRLKRISKPVYCDELKKRFNSICEAEKETGVLQQNIVSACKGRYKTAGGYHWKYEKALV